MTDIARNAYHCSDGLARLLSQYKDSSLLKAWICSYLDRVQDAEDTAIDVLGVLGIDIASGVHLDVIGRIVDEPRRGRLDDAYRRSLKVRLLVNKSNGRAEDLIQITVLHESVDVPDSVRVIETPPYAVIVVLRSVPEDVLDLISVLSQAKAAGVRLDLIYAPTVPSESLIVSSVYYGGPVTSSSRGLGSVYSTGTGGLLSGVLV